MILYLALFGFLCGGPSFGQGQVTAEEESIEELYQTSIVAYHEEKWMKSIKHMEMALVHYKMLQHMDMTCRTKCSSPNSTEEFELNFSNFPELKAYANLVVQAKCINLCIDEHPYGHKGIVYPSKKTLIDFEEGTTYNFLQYAYYRTAQIKKACQAAWTFLQKHPNHEAMKKNVAFYSELPDVEDEYFKDIEQLPHVRLYIDGANAYSNKDFDTAIIKLEEFLEEYYKAYTDCGYLCYKTTAPSHLLRLHEATASRYRKVVECILECEKQIAPTLNTVKVPKPAPQAYGYLQYAYFQTSQWEMSIYSASSELLLDQQSEMANSNLEFYKEFVQKNNLKDVSFEARPEALQHFKLQNTLWGLLENITKIENFFDEDEVIEDHSTTSVVQNLFQSEEVMAEIVSQISTSLSQNLKGELD